MLWSTWVNRLEKLFVKKSQVSHLELILYKKKKLWLRIKCFSLAAILFVWVLNGPFFSYVDVSVLEQTILNWNVRMFLNRLGFRAFGIRAPTKLFSTNLQDLFFQYSLNNFLHAQVEICVKYAFCCVNPAASKASTQIAFDDASWNNNNVATVDEDQAKTGTVDIRLLEVSGNQMVESCSSRVLNIYLPPIHTQVIGESVNFWQIAIACRVICPSLHCLIKCNPMIFFGFSHDATYILS